MANMIRTFSALISVTMDFIHGAKLLCVYVFYVVQKKCFALTDSLLFTKPIYPNFILCGEKAPLLYFYLWVCDEKLNFPYNPEYLKNFLQPYSIIH
jgi:hypothetical protein